MVPIWQLYVAFPGWQRVHRPLLSLVEHRPDNLEGARVKGGPPIVRVAGVNAHALQLRLGRPPPREYPRLVLDIL
jgi:hypothetical protein